MSRTTGRTLALLGLLQARREWPGAELRGRLEVSDRTLRRDIDDLRALGYGIEATRGVGGGYRLGAGAALPPLTLAPDEAVAIAVGLRAAATGPVTGIAEAAVRALAKLEQSLAPATRAQIAEVERALLPLGQGSDDIDMSMLTELSRTIAQHRRVRISYRRHDGRIDEPIVEPHRIVHTAHRWYLITRDPARRAWRTLRMDRIDHVTVLRVTFQPQVIPDDALRRATSRAIAVAPYPVLARVRVEAPADQVRQAFGPTVAEVAETSDGATVLVTGAHRPEEIVLYLGTSGLTWQLLDGDEVRDALRRLSAEFATAARSSPAAPTR